MDYLSRTKRQFTITILLSLLASNLLIIAGWITLKSQLQLSNIDYALILGLLAILLSILFTLILTKHLISPLKAIWQLIVHITPNGGSVSAPNIDSLKIGHELVANLSMQIYQLSSIASNKLNKDQQLAQNANRNFIANKLPLPLFILDKEETVVFSNHPASDYIGISQADIIGKNFYMIMDMAFPSENTLDTWLKEVKAKSATASMSWERVKLNVLDNHPTLLFDLAAYYNKDNPDNYETILVLFDHTKQYSQDDQAVSFVALSVHELRTPLTVLRGYIEALEEELSKEMNPELQEYMQKMNATAQQLTVFVNNILNVARVDNDQLQLQLREENWNEIVQSAIDAISLRAKVRGIELKSNIDPDLPTVGVDRLSIYEVINNLIDNAIKYSGKSTKIEISSYLSKDGMVETSIKDFGLGISPSIMPNLFTKFYRDHRNRAQIGGTGLGLYLSKAIISAHGGNIWVTSNLGKGSTFSFTIKPYALLAEELKNSNNSEIVHGAHGWIKNHSLYRR